jgi:hypothetical protein
MTKIGLTVLRFGVVAASGYAAWESTFLRFQAGSIAMAIITLQSFFD